MSRHNGAAFHVVELHVSAELLEEIDAARSDARIPSTRSHWILEAAAQRIDRENRARHSHRAISTPHPEPNNRPTVKSVRSSRILEDS